MSLSEAFEANLKGLCEQRNRDAARAAEAVARMKATTARETATDRQARSLGEEAVSLLSARGVRAIRCFQWKRSRIDPTVSLAHPLEQLLFPLLREDEQQWAEDTLLREVWGCRRFLTRDGRILAGRSYQGSSWPVWRLAIAPSSRSAHCTSSGRHFEWSLRKTKTTPGEPVLYAAPLPYLDDTSFDFVPEDAPWSEHILSEPWYLAAPMASLASVFATRGWLK